jgi:two-component system, OmpR family, response regulator
MEVAQLIWPQQERMPSPRVVVADDSGDMRELISLVLCNQGFSVVGAADGEAALETILAGGADGLVSDLCMPRLDGLALCRVLRALRSYATLPIVVFTGAAKEDHRLRTLADISGLRVLTKPMGLREIAPALIKMMAAA